MKRVIAIILVLVLLVLFYELYQLYRYNGELRENLSFLNGKFSQFTKDNSELRSDLEYFSEPENLEKELRSRFNYKNPGEKLIIVVPQKINE